MYFPKNTPRPIVDRMNAAIKKALDSADVKGFMTREALEAIASSPEELTTKFNTDSARYAKVIKAAGIKVQ
jgi:tripartite-type tricarboxylate transporter receptor subunit TctC